MMHGKGRSFTQVPMAERRQLMGRVSKRPGTKKVGTKYAKASRSSWAYDGMRSTGFLIAEAQRLVVMISLTELQVVAYATGRLKFDDVRLMNQLKYRYMAMQTTGWFDIFQVRLRDTRQKLVQEMIERSRDLTRIKARMK